jgi:hypothetical protein
MLWLCQQRGLIGWRVLTNIRSAVAVARCDEAGREIAPEQRDIGCVRPVGHAERAASPPYSPQFINLVRLVGLGA